MPGSKQCGDKFPGHQPVARSSSVPSSGSIPHCKEHCFHADGHWSLHVHAPSTSTTNSHLLVTPQPEGMHASDVIHSWKSKSIGEDFEVPGRGLGQWGQGTPGFWLLGVWSRKGDCGQGRPRVEPSKTAQGRGLSYLGVRSDSPLLFIRGKDGSKETSQEDTGNQSGSLTM